MAALAVRLVGPKDQPGQNTLRVLDTGLAQSTTRFKVWAVPPSTDLALPMDSQAVKRAVNGDPGYCGFVVERQNGKHKLVEKDPVGKWKTTLRDCLPPDELPK
ncbi:hypothetical protein HYT84_00090 [Candidatus Micrarchaeota archaeon]|nr:hypothetical protein [Candidatus Micrarchaeota archaeon]